MEKVCSRHFQESTIGLLNFHCLHLFYSNINRYLQTTPFDKLIGIGLSCFLQQLTNINAAASCWSIRAVINLSVPVFPPPSIHFLVMKILVVFIPLLWNNFEIIQWTKLLRVTSSIFPPALLPHLKESGIKNVSKYSSI